MWLSVLISTVIPSATNGFRLLADGQLQRSSISISVPVSEATAGEVVEQFGGDLVLVQADLRQDAEHVGDDHVLVAAGGVGGRLDDRRDHVLTVAGAGLDLFLDLAGVVRAVDERHLVVGRVDPVDSGRQFRQVEVTGGVQQFGFDPAEQFQTSVVGRRRSMAAT